MTRLCVAGFLGRLSWERDQTELFTNVMYLDSERDFDGTNKPDDTEPGFNQDSVRVHGGLRGGA